MRRISEVWFEFRGVRNTAMNVILMEIPARPHPAERGTQQPIPGRSGNLWIADGAYESIPIRVHCLADNVFDIDAISAWLCDAGDIRFSDEPTRVYKARITKEFARTNKLARFTAQEFTVPFECQPFRYRYLASPGTDDFTITAASAVVTNPGTYKSEPQITINGSGAVELQIGSDKVLLTGISDHVTLDCEARIAHKDGGPPGARVSLLGTEWPTLAVGSNTVTWSIPAGSTGSVSSMVYRPRWRWR